MKLIWKEELENGWVFYIQYSRNMGVKSLKLQISFGGPGTHSSGVTFVFSFRKS